ncbi:MAG TPA: NAD(P)/FAD-dependent oxidoreductase [Candidatus Eisenbacteria bacterium]|nr:NAD(P)/FAD-dependent oxidoreductase [Candidatus Eisenbacteria bacterium]
MSATNAAPHDARPAAPGVAVSASYDAVIVGGGPAGLSAALVLARCRRRIVVLDSGRYRNARAPRLHAYLTRDGTPPGELLELARAEVRGYGVEVRRALVISACPADGGFAVTLDSGERLAARKLLLATGVVDRLPVLEGIDRFYGVTVVHCPYCDAYELRDRPLGVYGHGCAGRDLSLALQSWSADVALFSDGPARLEPADRARLDARGIRVHSGRVRALEGEGDQLETVVLRGRGGEVRVPCRGLFLTTGQVQHSDLARSLGCERTPRGAIRTGRYEQTTVPGVFVVGDASRDPQLAIIAAAEGAKAAFAIHRALPVATPDAARAASTAAATHAPHAQDALRAGTLDHVESDS